jgi:hypothetical protein
VRHEFDLSTLPGSRFLPHIFDGEKAKIKMTTFFLSSHQALGTMQELHASGGGVAPCCTCRQFCSCSSFNNNIIIMKSSSIRRSEESAPQIMKSGSIRRSEESDPSTRNNTRRSSNNSSKRSAGAGGLYPTVPLPGGSGRGSGGRGYGGGGGGGRGVSEPCDDGGYHYSQKHLQQQQHDNNQNPPSRHRLSYQPDNAWIQHQQADDHGGDVVYDDHDESSFRWNNNINFVNDKENDDNHQISPDNKSSSLPYYNHQERDDSVVESRADSYGSSTYANTCSQTIALFGASGTTGRHFMQMALDAGYGMRCLPVDDPREVGGGGGTGPCTTVGWSSLQSSLQDSKQLARVLKSADYVVVMLNDLLPGQKLNKDYPERFLSDFLARLYPLMRRQASIQVFLYQVSSKETSRPLLVLNAVSSSAFFCIAHIIALLLFDFQKKSPHRQRLWHPTCVDRHPSCPRF